MQINGIEAVELLGSADPAAAAAVRNRGRKPVVERTAAQPLTLNGIEGVIFGDASSGPGSTIRLSSADPALAREARQRGQRAVLVVDSSGAVVGGWTPAVLGAALVGWFDAQDTATLTLSSGVQTWQNKAAPGTDATQGTAAARPAYNATGLNSLPAIIGASGDFLSTAISLAQPFSVAAAAQVTSTAANYPLLGTSTGSDFKGIFNQTGGSPGVTHQLSSQWTNGAITSPAIVCSIANGASSLLSNNGTTNGTHNVGAGSLANITIGRWANAAEYWVGPIGEVVLVNGALAAGERQKLEGYLAHKWGLTAGLPGDHPYKSSVP